MNLLSSFDIDKHFWREFPQFKVLFPFKELYKEDKSRDKAHSSQKMWAIAFICDPSKYNPYRNLSIEDKKTMLAKDWLKDLNYNWKEVEDCIIFYNKCLLTSEQKSVLAWKNKMDERDLFLEKTPYTLGNGVQLDKIMKETISIVNQLKSLEDKMEQSQTDDEKNKKIKSILDQL